MASVLKTSSHLIDAVPENILLEIFTYLSAKDLCTIGRVCKKWKRVAADNCLWRHVDLSPYKLNLRRMWKVLRTHFSDVLLSLKLRGFVDPVVPNWTKSSISDAMLKNLQEKCPSIKTLEFNKTNFEGVSVLNFPRKLQYLGVRDSMTAAGWFVPLQEDTKALPFLTHIDLSFSSKVSNRDIIAICSHPKICVLKLNGCYRIGEEGLKAIADSLPQLTTLEIGETKCSDLAVHRLARNLKMLNRFDMNRCTKISDGSLATIGMCLLKLKWFNLNGCASITQTGLGHLTNLKNLKFLDVMATQVNKVGLDSFLAKLPQCEILHEVFEVEESQEATVPY